MILTRSDERNHRAARRVSPSRDALAVVAVVGLVRAQPLDGSAGVFELGREGSLGREAVIHRRDDIPSGGQGRDGRVFLTAHDPPAAVNPEDHGCTLGVSGEPEVEFLPGMAVFDVGHVLL